MNPLRCMHCRIGLSGRTDRLIDRSSSPRASRGPTVRAVRRDRA